MVFDRYALVVGVDPKIAERRLTLSVPGFKSNSIIPEPRDCVYCMSVLYVVLSTTERRYVEA